MDVPSTHLDGRPSQDGIMSDEWCNISVGDSILAKKEKEKKGKLAAAPYDRRRMWISAQTQVLLLTLIAE